MKESIIVIVMSLLVATAANAEKVTEIPFGDGTLEITEHDEIENDLPYSGIILRVENLISDEENAEKQAEWNTYSLANQWLQIVRIGEKIWQLIEQNKAVANHQLKSASALPKGAGDWSDLQNWRTKTKFYSFKMRNLLRMTTVSFKYGINFDYNGTIDGKGTYLANVSAFAKDIYVMPTYKFDAKAEVQSVSNMGTRNNPEARMKFQVSWTVKTMGQHWEKSDFFIINAKGDITRQ